MEHLHSFKKINEDNSGILEICTECKFRLSTKKDPKTQRIDNRKFSNAHKLDLLQPFGRTGKLFRKYYGDKAQYINKYKG